MKGNVLIVEDLTELADVVARYLVKEGFEVKAVLREPPLKKFFLLP